jgi:glycosyltransferase involved in cell wall biosynthesis
VAGVAAALEKLSHDPELRQRLASGARDRSRRRTWDEVARETLAVYGRIAR